MKSPLCIVLCLCSAFMACKGENPNTNLWRDRPIEARLTDAGYQPFQSPKSLTASCENEVVEDGDQALKLLMSAGGPCLDRAVREVERHRKQDLAAAYLTRFERNDDPMNLLRALQPAQGFNRALALERLGLTREAIAAWDEVAAEGSGWGAEAARNRDRLQGLPDPLHEWNPNAVWTALKRRDLPALTRMSRAFPADSAKLFELADLEDRQRARLFATALAAAGDHYPMAVVEAMERALDPESLKQGLAAFHARDYSHAIPLLERAGNPLSLSARYGVAITPTLPTTTKLQTLDPALKHLGPEYRELSARIRMWRANLVETDHLLEAHADYAEALRVANGDPTLTAATLGRRAVNYAYIGDADKSFLDAYRAVKLLPHVADTNARNTAYGAAAIAAKQLGYPEVALYYQDAAVETTQRAFSHATVDALARAKNDLVVALRARAEIRIELEQDATSDLERAANLAESVENNAQRDLFRMRIHEVQGQTFLRTRPLEAAAAFSEALDLAKEENSTYRAMLYFKRAAAWRGADNRRADDDIATALHLLRNEVRLALATSPAAASKPLWEPYFSRFREIYRKLAESRIADGDVEGAFIYDELARAFEPMQILLQSRAGFRLIENVTELRQACANLPEDTVILQYLVLPMRTYTFIVTRKGVRVLPQRTTRAQIAHANAALAAAVDAHQHEPFQGEIRFLYGSLFRDPLEVVRRSKTRLVIVPDEPMHGLPFNGLHGRDDEGFLIDRYSIAVAGSTSLYLYAVARDRQLSADRHPAVLLIGDPAFPASTDLRRLVHAREEVEELARDNYPDAKILTDTAATVERFLNESRRATIIHFAGHALSNPQDPWKSRLLFAPQGGQSGELSAEALMQKLPELRRTRLVVLGACSTAGGAPVGPQGLAPLVRPLIGANVPAVVGSLWDVGDASTKQLLVSLHCHYRNGDDVAVALQKAQLEALRTQDPALTAMQWPAFQVVGYARSPYAGPIALEKSSSEHICTQSSLHRPDGLHPQ